ncbi:MAG: PQQ-like beta-propeller repeat protein [Planctomycetota bacterium]|nr:PQQ-like beta-propeller repeat protein [Planctomycetota bacterium]MDA1212908.1 PQQ-like beta-propeller repeat protein [Planctomycetota bacterium]
MINGNSFREFHQTFCGIAAVIGLLSFSASLQADDWPQWGGPQRDLVWREKGIVKEFKTDGLLPRMWSTPLSEGYSGPAVANGRVFITDRVLEKQVERVFCLDAETGDVIWQHAYPCLYEVSYPAGPRSTPVVEDGRVYTIGAMGDMYCYDEISGDVLWKKDFRSEYKTQLPSWGMVASPLVDGDQLITLVGGSGALVVSFNKETGEELWRSLDDAEIGYAPPVIFDIDGTRHLIIWHPSSVTSLNPDNGHLRWDVPYSVKAGLSIATPRLVGNKLFVASFYNGPRMIEITAPDEANVVWAGNSNSEQNTDGLHPIINIPWMNEDYIYGVCSYGQLRCLDVHTGKRIWETFKATGEGRWWNAFIVPHEDRYFIHNEQGELIIANLSPKGYEEISRALLVKPTRQVQRRMTIWSHPAFAMKSVFARNDEEIVRVNLAAE